MVFLYATLYRSDILSFPTIDAAGLVRPFSLFRPFLWITPLLAILLFLS